VDGDLVVDWEDKEPNEATAAIKRMTPATSRSRPAAVSPIFQLLLQDIITPPKNYSYSDPLILYDLDGDGLSEIILAAKNLVYRRRAEDHYQPEPLCRYPAEAITSAVIADFDGDGFAISSAPIQGLWLFKGSAPGHF